MVVATTRVRPVVEPAAIHHAGPAIGEGDTVIEPAPRAASARGWPAFCATALA
jgi:hypothetical protein